MSRSGMIREGCAEPPRLTRNFTLPLPCQQYARLQREASRRGVPMTELVRSWLAPHLESLEDDTVGQV